MASQIITNVSDDIMAACISLSEKYDCAVDLGVQMDDVQMENVPI